MVRLETVKSSKSATSKSNKENSSAGLWETDPYDEEPQSFDADVAISVITSKTKLSKFKKASGRLLLSSKPSTKVPLGEHKISSSAANIQEIPKLAKENLEKVSSDPKRKTSLKAEKSKVVSAPLFNCLGEEGDENNNENSYDNKNNKKSNSSSMEKEKKSSKFLRTEELLPKRKTSTKEKSDLSTVPLVASFKEISLESKTQSDPKRKSSLQSKNSNAAAAAIAVTSKVECEKMEAKRRNSLKDKKRRSNGNSDQKTQSYENNELKENDNSDSSKRKTSFYEKNKSLELSVESTARSSRTTTSTSSSSSSSSHAAFLATNEFVKPSTKMLLANNTQSSNNSNVCNSKNTAKRTKEADFLCVPTHTTSSSSVVVVAAGKNTNKIQKVERGSCCYSSYSSLSPFLHTSASAAGIIPSPSAFSSYPTSSLTHSFISPTPKLQVAAEAKKPPMRKSVMRARLQVLCSKDMIMLIARYLPGLELVRVSLLNSKYQSLLGDPNHRLWENLCTAAARKFRVLKREEDSWRRRYCQSLAICEACDLYAPTGDGIVACICCSAQYCDFNPPAGHVRFPSTPSVVPIAPQKVGMCYEQCWMLCWRCNDLIVMQNKKGHTGAVCRACCPPDRDVCEQCREIILLARTKPQWQTRFDEHKAARVLGLNDTMGEFMEFGDDNRSVTSQARYERHVPEDSIVETSTIFDPYC